MLCRVLAVAEAGTFAAGQGRALYAQVGGGVGGSGGEVGLERQLKAVLSVLLFCEVQPLHLRVWGVQCTVQFVGCMEWGAGCGVLGVGCAVWAAGCRV